EDLTGGGAERHGEDADAAGQGAIAAEGCGAVGAAQMNGAGVPGGGVAELVERGDGDVEGGAGDGRAGRRESEVGGGAAHDGDVVAGADDRGVGEVLRR